MTSLDPTHLCPFTPKKKKTNLGPFDNCPKFISQKKESKVVSKFRHQIFGRVEEPRSIHIRPWSSEIPK